MLRPSLLILLSVELADESVLIHFLIAFPLAFHLDDVAVVVEQQMEIPSASRGFPLSTKTMAMIVLLLSSLSLALSLLPLLLLPSSLPFTVFYLFFSFPFLFFHFFSFLFVSFRLFSIVSLSFEESNHRS
eukprot:m.151384 g.151384  ORF g.151384 m.151384 type:complete len:130 (-) comp16199_c4_seq1:926-1315(-)